VYKFDSGRLEPAPWSLIFELLLARAAILVAGKASGFAAVIDTETRFPTFLPNGHRLPIMLFQTISA